MIDTVPATEYYSLLALVGAIGGLLWGFVLGLIMAQPNSSERRTLRRALDAYIAAELTTDEEQVAKRLRWSSALKER